MSKSLRAIPIVVTLLVSFGLLASAQTAPGVARPTSSSDRLFLSFAEDATVVDRQWWEGQVEAADGDSADANIVRAVVAFQPWVDLELGGRVGFGDTDVELGPDGSGATDLDVWGKYHLGGNEETEFAVGGVVTVPTGDETAGLGSDAFGASAFGSLRHRLTRSIITGQAGIRFNGDGRRGNETQDRDGETSPMAGLGLIVPFSDNVAAVAEARYEDGRLEGDDSDTRVLGGVNWRPGGRGTLRGAIAFGLSDGAPDTELMLGYAAQF
jgi:hypothetical protein